MQTIAQTLSHLACGAPQRFRNITLWPLLSAEAVQPAYLTLDEALERQLARINEVSDSGSVPELRFQNLADIPVLLVDGEELVGAKQNRILNLTILVGAHKEVVIPVSCVEQGRWAYRSRQFSSAKRKLFASARAKKMARVSESLARSGSRRSDQGEVWEDIGAKFAQMRVESDSMAMADLYEARDADLAAYKHAFMAVPGQLGAVVEVDGKVAGMELFDAQQTFAQMVEKIVGSYAMDVIGTHDELTPHPGHLPQGDRGSSGEEQAVRTFLQKTQEAASREHAAIGEGTDVRLSAQDLAGAALVEGGRVVHLAAFRLAEEVA
jgi:hypothetical protein